MSISEKLIKVQSNLKAPKGQFNSFGKYAYRNCEDILEALKPLLSEQGLYIFIMDTVELIGERYYVKATVTISDGENSIFSTAYAREEETKKGMDGSQITGASSSYARKYALNGLFAIDDTKDADTPPEPQKDPPKKAEPQKIDYDKMRQDTWKMICDMCDNVIDTATQALSKYTVHEVNGKKMCYKQSTDVPDSEIQALYNTIKTKYDEKKGATNG